MIAVEGSPPLVPPVATPRHGHRRELIAIGAGTLLLVVIGALLVFRAEKRVNRVSLGAAPRPVTVVEASATEFRQSRSYVGAVESWVEASVGPQYISAYVKTVLVRPGDVVVRGQILATLDCANPSAASRSVEMQAQAINERQQATADEAARETTMLHGGFIAPNEVEQKEAQSSAERAQFLDTRARLLSASLSVHDCALRAPFDGEIATRTIDPGAFVHPGTTIVSVVDRNIVRVVVDAPEKDFEAAHIGARVQIEMLSTGAKVVAKVSRRSPRADAKTRTVHFEVDIADPHRQFPTGTTALVEMEVGSPVPATRIPLYAATQQEGRARVFVVEKGVAHSHVEAILGERGGGLYFDPKVLPAKTPIVTEGSALLTDGDKVEPRTEPAQTSDDADGGARGGGYGRPL